MIVTNRWQAGKILGEKLLPQTDILPALVVGIARGGVIVGDAIAKTIGASLTTIVVKKIGSPFNPELAIGAIGPHGAVEMDQQLITTLGVGEGYIKSETAKKRDEVVKREKIYQLKPLEQQLAGKKSVIVTDDGIATGATVKLVLKIINGLNRKYSEKERKTSILAIPVIAYNVYDEIKDMVNKMVVLEIPEEFNAVGQFYEHFPQVSDEEVTSILTKYGQKQ